MSLGLVQYPYEAQAVDCQTWFEDFRGVRYSHPGRLRVVNHLAYPASAFVRPTPFGPGAGAVLPGHWFYQAVSSASFLQKAFRGTHLDIVAHPVRRAVSIRKQDALPGIQPTDQRRRKVIVMLHIPQAERSLQLILGLLIVPQQNPIDVLNDPRVVRRAVLRHRKLHLLKVLPQGPNRLDDRAGALVRPKGPRRKILDPGGQGAAIGASDEDPGRLVGRAGAVLVKGQDDVLGKVDEVLDGLLEGEVPHVLRREAVKGRALAPVAVLDDEGARAELLGHDAGEGEVGGVALVAVERALVGPHEDDGRARAGVELVVPDIALRKGAQLRVVVVDELLEGAVGGSACCGGDPEAVEVDVGLRGAEVLEEEGGGCSREQEELCCRGEGPHRDGSR